MLELAGLKKFDIREKTARNTSLLFNKDQTKKTFDFVQFRNGYGSTLPYFKAKYSHFRDMEKVIHYPELGLSLSLGIPYYNIAFSEIVEYGYIHHLSAKLDPIKIKGSKIGITGIIPIQNLDWFQKPLFKSYFISQNTDEPLILNNTYCVDYEVYAEWYEKASGVIKIKEKSYVG
jgi:hypothetical protein